MCLVGTVYKNQSLYVRLAIEWLYFVLFDFKINAYKLYKSLLRIALSVHRMC